MDMHPQSLARFQKPKLKGFDLSYAYVHAWLCPLIINVCRNLGKPFTDSLKVYPNPNPTNYDFGFLHVRSTLCHQAWRYMARAVAPQSLNFGEEREKNKFYAHSRNRTIHQVPAHAHRRQGTKKVC